MLPIIISRLGTPDIVNFVIIVFWLDIVSWLLIFIQSLGDYAPSQNIKPRLRFRQCFPFICFLQTYMLRSNLFHLHFCCCYFSFSQRFTCMGAIIICHSFACHKIILFLLLTDVQFLHFIHIKNILPMVVRMICFLSIRVIIYWSLEGHASVFLSFIHRCAWSLRAIAFFFLS